MTNAIRCRQLHKHYVARSGLVRAVNGVDLDVPVGEFFGLLGTNGAGKTTTIEILEGLLEATAGAVEILGQHWGRDDHALRNRIGISLQELHLNEKLTAQETLTLFRSFYHQGRPAGELLAEVGLTEKANTYVGELSGGQRQRLAVACSLAGDPELLFLDEPTVGLDPQSRRQLWELLRRFQAAGRTIILTTHYMDEAERLCDRIAIMDQGRIIALGTPGELIARLGEKQLIEFALHDSVCINEDMLNSLPSVRSVRRHEDAYLLAVTAPHLTIPALLDRLEHDQLRLSRLSTRQASLEDVFVALTGRHSREEEGA
jgi:ABC-2 type transport system ATP-binding protein